MRETEDHSKKAEELLSQFKVVNFGSLEIKLREDRAQEWDKIIPKNDTSTELSSANQVSVFQIKSFVSWISRCDT